MNKKIFLGNHRKSNRFKKYNEGINSLNEDCLLAIFEYLSLFDKIKIERVSTRWNRLSKRSWSNFHNLKVEYPFVNGLHTKQYIRDDKSKYDKLVSELISRSGTYLNNVDLINCYISSNFFKNLSKHCRNIKILSIYDVYKDITDKTLEYLFLSNNLESLTLENVTIFGKCLKKIPVSLKMIHLRNFNMKKPEYFYDLLLCSKNLKNITLYNCNKNIISALITAAESTNLNISELYLSLEYLDGFDVTYYPTSNLIPLFENLKNLKKISLQSHQCDYLDEKIMINFPKNVLESLKLDYMEIPENCLLKTLPYFQCLNELILYRLQVNKKHAAAITSCLSLKKLYLYILETSELTLKGAKYFSSLCNLEEVSLFSIENFAEEIVLAIAECKNLKVLSINFCPNITSNGLKKIISLLPNLEILRLVNLQKISDNSIINNLTSLQEFCCSNCVKITNYSLSRLLMNSPNLKLLHIWYCKKVKANDLIDTLVDTVNVRGNVLLIDIEGIKCKDIKNLSAFIKVLSY